LFEGDWFNPFTRCTVSEGLSQEPLMTSIFTRLFPRFSALALPRFGGWSTTLALPRFGGW
jgi:hypothetical protein